MIGFLGSKQIRHAEHLIYICKSLQVGCARHNKVNGSCLRQLYGLLRGTQYLIWKNLNLIFVSQILLHIFLKF